MRTGPEPPCFLRRAAPSTRQRRCRRRGEERAGTQPRPSRSPWREPPRPRPSQRPESCPHAWAPSSGDRSAARSPRPGTGSPSSGRRPCGHPPHQERTRPGLGHGRGTRRWAPRRSRPPLHPQKFRWGPPHPWPRKAWGSGAGRTARFEVRGRTPVPTGSAAWGPWTSRSRECVRALRARRCVRLGAPGSVAHG